jgi:hypothetical protein
MHKLTRAGIGAGVAVLSLGAAVPAFADPGQGAGLQTQQFSCSGLGTVTIVTPPHGGVPGFLDGTVYVLDSITVTGPGFTFTKTYGNRNGAGAPVSCSAIQGPVTIDVVAVPVGQAAK